RGPAVDCKPACAAPRRRSLPSGSLNPAGGGRRSGAAGPYPGKRSAARADRRGRKKGGTAEDALPSLGRRGDLSCAAAVAGEGPEVVRDEENFERLNTPAYHPARDAQDSFYLGDGWLLRTHTTVVDVHVLDTGRPPMRALAYGHCYRRDPVDASHSPMFHQVD